jgi:hypothetical protein
MKDGKHDDQLRWLQVQVGGWVESRAGMLGGLS